MTRNYIDAVAAIKTAVLQGQYEAVKEVNRVQLAVYFAIGKFLSANTRKGVWGSGAIESISNQLRRELPGLRGFSATQMKEMRLFYEGWIMLDANSSDATDELQNSENKPTDAPSVITDGKTSPRPASIVEGTPAIDIYHTIQIPQLKDFPVQEFFNVPFSHHTRILAGVKDIPSRYYYIRRTSEEHLSVDKLKKLISEKAHEHTQIIPNNFPQTLSAAAARKAVTMFKDEYLLNFINTEEIGERDSEDIDEHVVEQQIVQNIKKFIMTFGSDFSFVGNQYRLEVYGEEYFPDLLFFNRELNALVVIELKTGKFKPSYLGQLSAYLRILDDKVRKPHENPSIGIVLCKSASNELVEYIIQDYDKPMGVATYKTTADMPEPLRKALPDTEDLKKLL